MRIARLAALGMVASLAGCIVHDTPTVNPGYGDGYGNYTRNPPGASTVGEPSPAYVSGMPPEPLYEQMTDSPADGSVWIDGYWHWNGYEWVWVQGRWEQEQQGYVYVEPNYDYVGDQYVYTPGYWSQPDRAPRGWSRRDHRDGRPTIFAPPITSGGYRRPIAVGTRRQVRPPSPGAPSRVEPRGPQYDPRGATTWQRGVRRPIGVFNAPQPGAVQNPVRGGTIWRDPPASAPVAPTTPPPVPTVAPAPQAQPAPQVQPAPVWTPVPTARQPPPPMGRPLYVNPPGPADQQRPAHQLGGPTYVQPAGPQPTTSPAPGNAFRPAPAAPPPHVAPPPPPPSPAPGPRSNNARRPQ